MRGRGWTHPENEKGVNMKCHSVGFLVADDDASVTITTSYSEAGGDVLDALTIPKVAILEQREIQWIGD